MSDKPKDLTGWSKYTNPGYTHNPTGPWTSYKFHYTSFPVPTFKNLSDMFKRTDLPKFESTEPVVGYRVWNLDREALRLKSCIQDTYWPFREKMVREQHPKNLGIHASKFERDIFEVGISHPSAMLVFDSVGLWSDYHAQVAGEVWMWGEITEHEHGYLSEFAYPKSLWMPESTDPMTVMQLEENYGVPVTLRPDLGAWKQTAWDVYFNSAGSPSLSIKPSKNTTFFTYPGITNIDSDDKNEEKT